MCEALQCLPRAGGFLDQDTLFVIGTRIVFSAKAKKAELDQRKAK